MKIKKSSNVTRSVEGYAACACVQANICSCVLNGCECQCYDISNLKTSEHSGLNIRNQDLLRTNLISALSTNGKAV